MAAMMAVDLLSQTGPFPPCLLPGPSMIGFSRSHVLIRQQAVGLVCPNLKTSLGDGGFHTPSPTIPFLALAPSVCHGC